MDDRNIWLTGADVCTQRQWQALVLVYGYELSRREAARIMGISHSAVDKLIDRGLERIRTKANAARKDAAA